MNQPSNTPNRIHPFSVVAALIVAGLLFLLVYVLVLMVGNTNSQGSQAQPSQAITVIPAPTETPIIRLPTPATTPTTEAANWLPSGVIGVGAYVKVERTEGAGLRMRTEASTSADVRFIAMDEEVFLVIGGPVQANNYTWWQIEAPYDKNRSGWSVDSFLDVVELTTPTP